MKVIRSAFTLALLATLFTVPAAAEQASQESTTKLRVVAYNVACGQWATPEQLAKVLKPLNADILLLSEVPTANRGKDVKDWSKRLAEALDLKHVHVGTVSSANHKAPKWGDVTGNYGGKFKSIISRTPLSEGKDISVEGSGWKRASAVRVETKVAGRKIALYSLHLPGYAHNKKQPTKPEAWENSKHKALSDHINAEDPSYDVIVGGDFNEWNDSVVMRGLSKTCKLKNAITEQSIDHILYSTTRPLKLTEAKRDWGPKNQNKTNLKAEGCLSDHPWVLCEFEIPSSTDSEGSTSADEDAKPVKNATIQRVAANGFGIVPMPYEAKAKAGKPFVITKETVIIGQAAETKNCATYLQQRLRKSCGLTLLKRGATKGTSIVLMVSDDAVAFSENDAYRLDSSADKITISAKTERGLFYGVQSLLQLLPPAVYGDKPQAGLELKVPALIINDKPSMDRMRGLHVDISRHFRTKEEMFKIIDSMAMHKLNTMHLHLTDTQGWRVEIKAYPKLTTIGAIGNKTDANAPAKFFTQVEMKEIVAYANSRHISIFPEIDMPGHMGAAIRAYPELNHPKDVNDKQYAIRGDAMGREFAKKVLTEINDLFDSKYIHIGFDEVNYGAKAELYTDPELLDFAKEITTFIKDDLKKTPIVWDDLFMHGFEDKDTVVQWWRYGKNYWWKRLPSTVDEALNKQQQPFIFSPANWTYFDMKNIKGGWAGGISPAEMYNWDPYADMLGVTAETRKLALGAIACTWSEKIPTMKVFGDRTFPRLAGFSERIWRGGKQEAPNILGWTDYRDQVLIPLQLKRYDALGLHYWSKDNPALLENLEDVKKPLQMTKPRKKRVQPKASK